MAAGVSKSVPQFPDDYYIVDAGMNDGKDSDYYARRGFSVIAYEANPQLCEEADQRFKDAGLNVDVRNRAISNVEGTLDFYINQFASEWSSLNQELGERVKGAEVIKVKSCNLAEDLWDICDRLHYVKIDIEGYDFVALEQLLTLPTLPTYISVENGDVVMLETFRRAGYTRFKFSNQRNVECQTIPGNSPHGHQISYNFELGSSGVFGEDTYGRWISYDEAMQINDGMVYGRTHAPNNLWAECVGWFDLHAALPEDV
ncbi:FkbM family methyltransferase [Rhodovibrionaceae bacterium A322]